MEQYTNTKVCYYKILTIDTYIFLSNYPIYWNLLEQRIPDFSNCDNYGSLSANNPDPMLDDTLTNDNELHQVVCNNFKIDYY